MESGSDAETTAFPPTLCRRATDSRAGPGSGPSLASPVHSERLNHSTGTFYSPSKAPSALESSVHVWGWGSSQAGLRGRGQGLKTLPEPRGRRVVLWKGKAEQEGNPKDDTLRSLTGRTSFPRGGEGKPVPVRAG